MIDRPDISRLTTESRNPNSINIDALDTLSIVRLINREDQCVAQAVASAQATIAQAVDSAVSAFRRGGRLIYFGAGTSGRLGVLDASECPPTFNSPPDLVVGLIAGGDGALRRAIEGAEDNSEQAKEDLQRISLDDRDCAVGIATSGRTPYVIGGLRFARQVGAATVGIVCNQASAMTGECDILIEAIVGPEVVSGSTRMKAGTATKLILNTISTAAMVRTGKTYGNLMVDLRATNSKLVSRSLRLVRMMTGLDPSAAERLMASADFRVKTAVVMHYRQVDSQQADQLLASADGQMRSVIGDITIQHVE